MQRIQNFEDIIAWQKAKELVVKIYSIMKDSRDYKYREQIQSASVSIMNNIAEGYERVGDRQLKQFLFIAKGSCGEVRSMIHMALDLNLVSKEDGQYIFGLCLEISRLLSGFIKKLN